MELRMTGGGDDAHASLTDHALDAVFTAEEITRPQLFFGCCSGHAFDSLRRVHCNSTPLRKSLDAVEGSGGAADAPLPELGLEPT